MPRSSGRIFYCETRYSLGKPSVIYEFRTVWEDILATQDSENKDIKVLESFPVNRTAVGHFLRKYYLDELPQIYNIIKGDMNFVGPRPPAERYYRKHVDLGNVAKSNFRGGLTGPWQAQKGAISELEDVVRVENENYYAVAKLSPLSKFVYDLRIVFDTFNRMREAKAL